MVYKTSDNNFGTAKWIVDSTAGQGTHTTIASALTDSSSGDTIFIRPGTYTENLTLKAGVNLSAYNCDAYTPNVTIVGKCTHNTSGSISCSGIRFQTNSDNCIVISGANASNLYLINCWIQINNTTAISLTSSSSQSILEMYSCRSESSGASSKLFDVTGVNDIRFYHCRMSGSDNNSTLNSTSHHCGFVAYHTLFDLGISTSGTNGVDLSIRNCSFTAGVTAITLADSGGSSKACQQCFIYAGSSAGVSVGSSSAIQIEGCMIDSSNTNPISGAGQALIAGISLTGGPIFSTTTTTSNFTNLGKAVIQNLVYVLAGSGSPSGSITAPKGSLYMRTDGSSTSTRAYINTNGGTTWTAITTVA